MLPPEHREGQNVHKRLQEGLQKGTALVGAACDQDKQEDKQERAVEGPRLGTDPKALWILILTAFAVPHGLRGTTGFRSGSNVVKCGS